MTAKHCAKETRQKTVNQLSCHWSTVASWHDWQQSLTAFVFLILSIHKSQSQWLMAAYYNDRIPSLFIAGTTSDHTQWRQSSRLVLGTAWKHHVVCIHTTWAGQNHPGYKQQQSSATPDRAGHAIVCQPGSWICHRVHSNMLSSASATAASTSSGDTSPGAASPSGAAAGIGSAPAAGSLKSDLEE